MFREPTIRFEIAPRDAEPIDAMVVRWNRKHPDQQLPHPVNDHRVRMFRQARCKGRFVYVVFRGVGARIIGFLPDRVTILPNRRNPYAAGGGFTQNQRRYSPDRVVLAEQPRSRMGALPNGPLPARNRPVQRATACRV